MVSLNKQSLASLMHRLLPMPLVMILSLWLVVVLLTAAPVMADESIEAEAEAPAEAVTTDAEPVADAVDEAPSEAVTTDVEPVADAVDEAPAEPVAADAEPVADAVDEAPVATEEAHAPASHDAAIVRAVFTSAVDAREPVDQLDAVADDATELVFFTELAGLADRHVSHHWEGGERPPFAMDFDIGGDHWRVWSQRTVMPDDPGPWVVSVRVDGEALAQFTVGR